MQRIRGVVMVAMLAAAVESMAAQATTPTPLPAQTPAAPVPGAPAPGGQPPVTPGQPGAATVPGVAQLPVTTPPIALTPACPAPVPPAPTRAFTAPTGLLLHQVAPTRTADFERLIGYVRAALEKTTNATLRNQAKGWRFFKVSDVGPNGDIMYAFLLDPAVPCVDYALAPILADAYPDTAQLTEIWNLYKTSVRTGGTIINLVPLAVEDPEPIVTPPVAPVGTQKPGAPAGTQKPAVP
jgi:hypothetical protein